MTNIYDKSTYYYDLPPELIAQTPVEPRDSARMLVYNRQTKKIEDKIFRDVIDYLREGDALVINTTRVIPARLFGQKQDTGAKIELLLLKRFDLNIYECLAKPGKRLKQGTIIDFYDQNNSVILQAKVLDDLGFGSKKIEFIYTGVLEDIFDRIGTMPLPPYIKKKCENPSDYNTVYARQNGSSAAPTAGLHFTNELLKRIKAKGVKVVNVLLHVGLGTFRPVSEDNILDHQMHTEYYEVSKHAADIINETKQSGHRVIAVGTTSVRTLESACNKDGIIIPQKQDTSIFIYPGYKFKVVDAMITNFHLPESTLIMLVSAFCGVPETLKMYKHAVKQKYRFFSFGDATLLL